MFYLDSLVSFNSLIYFHFSCFHPFTIQLLLCFIIVLFPSIFVFCLLLLRFTVFIFSNWWLFTFLVHQGSHVTPFIPPIDFDLDTLAWEVTSGLGLYIHVSDWSWHDFGVCVWFIFSSGIKESLFISILCLVEFRLIDTSVLKKKKKCDDKFVHGNIFH